MRGSSDSDFIFTVGVEAEGLDWALEEITVPGITASSHGGHGSGSIIFSLDMTQVPSDLLTRTFTITDTNSGDEAPVTINFDFQLPQFSFTESALELDASFGWDITSLANQVSLNTGSNSYTIDIAVEFPIAESWSAAAQIQASGTQQEIALDFIPFKFYEGSHSGTVTLSTTVDGEPIQGSFDFVVKASEQRLIAHDNGIAFSSFPGKQVLQQSVLIDDSYWQGGVPWSASTEASWLTIDTAGITGNSLSITAHLTDLAQDTLHTATVTVASSNGAVENTETIYVGFWIGSADPQPKVVASADYDHLVTNPVKPYVYAAKGKTVDVYNVYTGALANTFDLPESNIGSLTISSDGRRLFARASDQGLIIAYDLESGTSSSWPQVFTSSIVYLRHGRVNGKEMLFASGIGAIDAEDGSLISGSLPVLNRELDVSENGKVYCTINSSSAHDLNCYDLAFASLPAQISATSRSSTGNTGHGRDLAISADGSFVYAAGTAVEYFAKYDTATGERVSQLAADIHPNCVEIATDGTLHAASSVIYGEADFWTYDGSDTVKSTAYISGYSNVIKDRALTVSAEGQITVLQTDEPSLVFFRTY